MKRASEFRLPIFLLMVISGAAMGQTPDPVEPTIADASDDAELAMTAFKFPDHLEIKLFASEPVLANPVAIDIDNAGRVFVCETFRQEFGVEDNREHPEWLNDDLAAESVQDRINYIKKHEPNIKREYHDQDDRIRLLIDTDKDGTADQSSIFSSGYNAIEDGTGAGVLAVGEDVFYTNIPHLWRLRDKNNDGVADQRESLHSGFGVRFAFRGHDLHGLIVGPDQRLYFSIGDRGYNVSPEIKDPVSGAVFSCELDGSDLRVFATGLRNPQELAFDDFGNLFTGDNNSDSGDKARWVYVVEGGDSGWRMYYQYLPDRGPFNREKIWHPFNGDTPAYVVPPIDNLGDGPSGLAFDPGTGLTEHFRQRFLLCDFRGTSSVSGIRTFRLEAEGAGFKIIDAEKTIWNTLATDAAFGPDGKLYVSDWVFGWQGVGKGRIYTYGNSADEISPVVAEVQSLLENGVGRESDQRLVSLLGHADRRVRYVAQFELVHRQKRQRLVEAFLQSGKDDVLKAVHGIWGFTKLATIQKSELPDSEKDKIKGFLERCDVPEIQAQLAKMMGELGDPSFVKQLVDLLSNDNSRVGYMASIALGKIGGPEQLDPILQWLTYNDNKDAFVRHAGIMGLTGILSRMSTNERLRVLRKLKSHPASAARLATVVALRKLKSNLLAEFLDDLDSKVVLEAARAIHDLPLRDKMQDLARLIVLPDKPDALTRRVINANLILGTETSARALTSFALDPKEDLQRRRDVFTLLEKWNTPSPLDYVLGDWRPLNLDRNAQPIDVLLKDLVDQALPDIEIADSFLSACMANNVQVPVDKLTNCLESELATLRKTALQALRKQDEAEYRNLVVGQLKNPLTFPQDWFPLLSDFEAKLVIAFIESNLNSNVNNLRKRAAIDLLGAFAKHPASTTVILDLLDRATTDQLDIELHLDAVLTASRSENSQVKQKLTAVYLQDETKAKNQIPFKMALHGGDPERGRQIFYERTELSCLRCHTIGSSGGNVGPVLSRIGLDKSREYILEAIVHPNQTIAEGFNESIILTDEGTIVTGIKKDEDDESVTLLDKDGLANRVLKDSIEDEKIGKSSMPEDLIQKITISELRDLVEFLAQQKSTERVERTAAGH